MNKSDNIEQLAGGNVNGSIKKIDNIIYRQIRNKHLHSFYQYMEAVDFKGVPRFLGIDNNREKLTFIEGYVPGDSFPNCDPCIWTNDNLVTLARFIKAYHDMSAKYVKASALHGWHHQLFKQDICEVICHNDGAPYNFVYQDGNFVGMIDFDEAYPATRIWDLAYILYTNIPLASYQPNLDGTTRPYQQNDAMIRRERIKLFFTNYGIDYTNSLFDTLIKRLETLCELIRVEAISGNLGFKQMLEKGEVTYYLKEIEFIKANYHDWI